MPDVSLHRRPSSFRPYEVCLWILVAILGLARIHLLFVRVYDPDEFEHLHAAYALSTGLIPYRDFFEHHGPITYWFGSAIVKAFGATPDLLTINRFISLFLSAITAIGTYLLARQVYGKRAALWAIVGMLTFPVFVEKSVEWRPDALATPLIVFATLLIVVPTKRPFLASLMAGSLLAMALFTTQKTLFLATGLFVAALLTWRAKGSIGKPITGFITGGAIVGLVVMGVLIKEGAWADAYLCLFERLANWPTKTRGPNVLFGMNSWVPGHQAAVMIAIVSSIVIGLSVAMRGWKERKSGEGASPHSYPLTHTLPHPRKGVVRFTPLVRRGWLAVVLPLITHLLGILITPAIYFQFYMLAIPLLAVFTAGEWVRCWRCVSRSQNKFRIAWLIAVAMIAWMGASIFLLPRGPVSLTGFDLAALILIGIGVLASYIIPRLAIVLLLIGFFVPSLGRIAVPHFFWPNRIQKHDVAMMSELVHDDEKVLDGFTGMGCLRPHLNYWWWINEHTIPMMRATGEDAVIMNEVASGKPAVILFDDNLRSLGIEQLLARHYVPLPLKERRPYFILLRRDLWGRWERIEYQKGGKS